VVAMAAPDMIVGRIDGATGPVPFSASLVGETIALNVKGAPAQPARPNRKPTAAVNPLAAQVQQAQARPAQLPTVQPQPAQPQVPPQPMTPAPPPPAAHPPAGLLH